MDDSQWPLWVISGRSALYHPNVRFRGHSGRSTSPPTPRELDSPGSLRTLARVPEPIAVLEVPLIAA